MDISTVYFFESFNSILRLIVLLGSEFLPSPFTSENLFWHIGLYEPLFLPSTFTSENLSFFMAEKESIIFDPLMEGIFSGVILGVKSCIMIFIFI